jgi:hypothetical protein
MAVFFSGITVFDRTAILADTAEENHFFSFQRVVPSLIPNVFRGSMLFWPEFLRKVHADMQMVRFFGLGAIFLCGRFFM